MSASVLGAISVWTGGIAYATYIVQTVRKGGATASLQLALVGPYYPCSVSRSTRTGRRGEVEQAITTGRRISSSALQQLIQASQP